MGTSCDADIDECISNPCLNSATCVNTVGSYRCSCAFGYAGNACQLDVNTCRSAPCFNGATCVNKVDDFQCLCASGFSGSRCETDINDCLSMPCLNGGTCVDQVCVLIKANIEIFAIHFFHYQNNINWNISLHCHVDWRQKAFHFTLSCESD